MKSSLVIHLKKLCLTECRRGLSYVFSFQSFVLKHAFKSMIYFELIFKYNVRCGFRFIFSLSFDIGISSCFKTFAEKLLFLHQLSLHVCKTLSCSCMWGSISLLFILIYLLILKSMPYCLYCYRFILSSWRRDGYPLQYSCLENSGQRSLESDWVTNTSLLQCPEIR